MVPHLGLRRLPLPRGEQTPARQLSEHTSRIGRRPAVWCSVPLTVGLPRRLWLSGRPHHAALLLNFERYTRRFLTSAASATEQRFIEILDRLLQNGKKAESEDGATHDPAPGI